LSVVVFTAHVGRWVSATDFESDCTQEVSWAQYKVDWELVVSADTTKQNSWTQVFTQNQWLFCPAVELSWDTLHRVLNSTQDKQGLYSQLIVIREDILVRPWSLTVTMSQVKLEETTSPTICHGTKTPLSQNQYKWNPWHLPWVSQKK